MTGLLAPSMNNLTYTFDLRPARRETAFFYVVFVAYPRIIAKFLFRRPSAQTVLYVLFSPLLGLRNLVNGLLCAFPFCPDIDYRLTLHDSHLSFGPDLERAQMANSYDNIEGLFKAGKNWIALLHDGYIVYLPPLEAGVSVANEIQQRQNAQCPAPSS